MILTLSLKGPKTIDVHQREKRSPCSLLEFGAVFEYLFLMQWSLGSKTGVGFAATSRGMSIC